MTTERGVSFKVITQRRPEVLAKNKMNMFRLLSIPDIFKHATKAFLIGDPINPLNPENIVVVI